MQRLPSDGLHTMAAVRALTGLSDRQLRYYDQQGLVVPRRSPGRHRLYSDAQVARLIEVRRLLGSGLTIREAARLLPPATEDGRPAQARHAARAPEAGPASHRPRRRRGE